MAGFFAFRAGILAECTDLNPIGYKIGLEIMVKTGVKNVGEVPIHFQDRAWGVSKLDWREQIRFLKHLRRLYVYKFSLWSDLAHFLGVGATGVVVNLVVLTLLVGSGVAEHLALALAIGVSMVSNFVLNRRFTFGEHRRGPFFRQLAGFVAACSAGAVLNYAVAVFSAAHVIRDGPIQVSALMGIAAGTGLNFIINRYWVFPVRRDLV
jgi:dolichol-phosphate mannosyltransferase